MSFSPEHEIHKRRSGRNIGVAVVLAGFIAIVFGLTVVKVTRGDPMAGFDHVAEPRLVPLETSE